MVGWLLIGLAVGFAAGAAAMWALERRRATSHPPVLPALAREESLDEPVPGPADDVREALDATRGLLDELESRYHGRKAPAGDAEPKPASRRRRR